jgi:HEAT repeat protein
MTPRLAASLGCCLLLSAVIGPPAWGASATQPASAPAGDDPLVLNRTLADLKSGDWILQWEAMVRLSQWKAPSAVAPLREVLAKNPSPWLRGRALLALATIQGEQALADAVAACSADSNELRQAAVEALGIIGSPRGAPAAAKLLKDPDPQVSRQALLSYAKILKAQAWDEVSRPFATKDRTLILAAIPALACVGTDESRRKLTELISGKDTEVRLATASALKDARDEQMLGVILERIVVEKEKKVRLACEAALQSFDRGELTGPLLNVLKAEQPAVYPTALRLLSVNPTPEVAREVSARVGWIGANCPEALATALGILAKVQADASQNVFVAHLSHKQADVRLAAVEALASCKRADLFAAFRDRLVDADSSVRSAAFAALRASSQTPPGGLLEYLWHALGSTDPNVCWNALSLLGGRLTAAELPKAMTALDRFLADADEKERDLAAAVLAPVADKANLRQIALAQGYVMNWAVLGPFPNNIDNTGLTTTYGPEEEVDLARKYKGLGDREIFWLRQELKQIDGTIDLNSTFWEKAPYKVAYLTAELSADQDRTVYLHLEGAGSFLVYLNGKEAGKMTQEQAQIALKLNKGPNRLLIKAAKSTQGANWWVRARLTDKSGRRGEGVTVEAEK